MQNNKKIAKQLLIWGGILIILLVILWGYKQGWWSRDLSKVTQEQREQTTQEVNDKIDEIAYWGYRIFLTDVSGGEATGEAAYRFMNDQYEHMVVAELPEPPEDYFYEGWLMRTDPDGYISTGKMFKSVDDRYTLIFVSSTNYSGFPKVVITLEPDDGNLEPDKHILEGGFN